MSSQEIGYHKRKWSSQTRGVPEPQAMNSEFPRTFAKIAYRFKTVRETEESPPPARKLMTSTFQESTRESREHSQNSRWQGTAKEMTVVN